jgi:hypothetical protein
MLNADELKIGGSVLPDPSDFAGDLREVARLP